MSGTSGDTPGQNPPPTPNGRPGGANALPPVLKNELPSVHVLKYMDGLSKRSGKMLDSGWHFQSLIFVYYVLFRFVIVICLFDPSFNPSLLSLSSSGDEKQI